MRHIGFTVTAIVAWAIMGPTTKAQPRLPYDLQRKIMVQRYLVEAGIKDPNVLRVFQQTPRHEFVPESERAKAYLDMALPIGHGQTISSPFIVAYMTEQLQPEPDDKVLEIGTGSGYQAAILSPLVKEVYSIEIVQPLAERAKRTLKRLGYDNVYVKAGDGYLGWPEYAPFDKIIVTCSPEDIPQPLVDQLAEGGRMVVPVGQRYSQTLVLLKKANGRMVREALRPTLFVPMTGEAESRREQLPDPTEPALANGDFEEVDADTGMPLGWYYQRQLAVRHDDPPSGRNYIELANEEVGRRAQALAGFGVDGRVVNELTVRYWVRAENVRVHPNNLQPGVGIVFFDERRAVLSEVPVGSHAGTAGWRQVERTIRVPSEAREAIIGIGLLGNTGKLAFDDVEVTKSRGRDTGETRSDEGG
ncbi:protein-L-isoaspartate(D-aspartate) O-methyltransferase [Thermostilla marina]